MIAKRIQDLPPYLFARIDKLKAEARARGADLIDLGIGDPDLPTPPHVVEALAQAARKPEHHRYPSYEGMRAYREACARFMKRRFSVELDPEREIVALIGSKEGIAHLAWALVDPGDRVACPDPGYPVYATTARFAGGEVVPIPLTREHGFRPAGPPPLPLKLAWLCFPNNPTGATVSRDFYASTAEWAREHGVVIGSDLAYSEIYFDGPPPPSFLEVGKDVGIEFHSLSKTFNMTGWRVGWACGRADVVAALGKVKTNVDSGVFEAVQAAAIAALDGDPAFAEGMRRIYRERRDVLVDGLAKLGFDVIRPAASFYVLCGVPAGMTSLDFATRLLEETAIVAAPATGFGPGGEGFVRFALTQSKERIAEAVERMSKLKI
ncbi:MAG: LL-diaminopimelate aminotransferase [Myxococcota bacterium]